MRSLAALDMEVYRGSYIFLVSCSHVSQSAVLQRFYVGRPVSGLVWLLTGGLFGIGWVIDFFLIPEFVEEVSSRTSLCVCLPHCSCSPALFLAVQHNKKVFHQQMLETGSSLLFDGEYGAQGSGYMGGDSGAFSGAVAPYAQHVYYPQTNGYAQQRGGGGQNYGYY
jgi:hypothetical protein